jgi:hypothetical protein
MESQAVKNLIATTSQKENTYFHGYPVTLDEKCQLCLHNRVYELGKCSKETFQISTRATVPDQHGAYYL